MSTTFLIDPTTGKIYDYLLPTGGGGGTSSDVTLTAGTGIGVTFADDVYTVSNPYTFTGTSNVTVTQDANQWIFSSLGGTGDVTVTAGVGIGIGTLAPNYYAITNVYTFTGSGDCTVTLDGDKWIVQGTAPGGTITSLTAGNEGIVLQLTNDTEYVISNGYLFTGQGNLTVTYSAPLFYLDVPPAPTSDLLVTNADDTIAVTLSGTVYEVSCPISVTSGNPVLLTITQDGPQYILYVTDSVNVFTVTGGTENIAAVALNTAEYAIYAAVPIAGIDNVSVSLLGAGTDQQYSISAYGLTGGAGVEVVATDNNYVINITGAGIPSDVIGTNGIIVTPDAGSYIVSQRNLPFYMAGSYEVVTAAVGAQQFGMGNAGTFLTSDFVLTVSSLNLAGESVGRYMGAVGLNTDPSGLILSIECVTSSNPANVNTHSGFTFVGLQATATNDFYYFQSVAHVDGSYDPTQGDVCTLSVLSSF